MKAIVEQIARHTGRPFEPGEVRHVGGGCINDALLISGDDQQWFIKLNASDRMDMFEAEADGLRELAGAEAVRVPEPLCTGIDEDRSFIVMEHIKMGGGRGGSSARAAHQLAVLHRQQAERFGWYRDNTIGSTHQENGWEEDWIEFWRERRLGFQLRLAARNGVGGRLQSEGEKLLERFPVLIDHAPSPSLLHGDLWGGNLAYDMAGDPVIFDPAVYFGDREAELAMTELFGGFGRDFYSAYNEAWPLDPGYRVRKTLYNLYHILNHANMFGGGYPGQAQSMIGSLLAEC